MSKGGSRLSYSSIFGTCGDFLGKGRDRVVHFVGDACVSCPIKL